MSPPTLRIACAQLSPVFKDVQASIARADELIASSRSGEIDLLVLPEMAFTGYCFTSPEDIKPFLEDPSSGPTFRWASSTAVRLQCYVLIGAPTLSPTHTPSSASSSSTAAPSPAFNSLLLLSPTGALLHTYHKHHLYETDESWATAGPSFTSWELPFPPSSPSASASDSARTFKLVPSICMDLNPKGFVAPFEAYELATFAKEVKADLVVCSMAWLDSEPPTVEEEAEEGGAGKSEMDEWMNVRKTLSYWSLRCDPLWGSGVGLVACDRVGREGDVVFTGSSCAIVLEETPEVLEHAPKRGESLLRVDLPLRAGGRVEL
ncbi:carbon-nitrogen hydrolase [Leucosporidium creatinivorum]|uniref:Carbon-nitrogen hydrolase n=1 Tax=Leucosporidium creatinivorum TaxID=106004 RepID=A0A1Y2G468_9BASI|nr:carbon-nitrogen hydrolase [Leucosporidium creatinivorum]